MLSTDLAGRTDQLDRLSSNVAGWGLRARAISHPQFASITSLQKRDRAYLNKHDTTNNNKNNNNNKTCNAHLSTLLGVQGAVKPENKQNKEKQTQQN